MAIYPIDKTTVIVINFQNLTTNEIIIQIAVTSFNEFYFKVDFELSSDSFI